MNSSNQALPVKIELSKGTTGANPGGPVAAARGAVIFGMIVIGSAFGGVGYWAATVPIASGAVAPGQIVVDTNRKTIQHLEGGIIKEIKVTEGDEVKKGDVLVILDDTQVRANLNSLRGQLLALHAEAQRLEAESMDATELTIKFDDRLLLGGDKEKVEALAAQVSRNQIKVFNARNEAIQSQIDIHEQRIKQLEEQIAGLDALQQLEADQASLAREELATAELLYKERNERQSNVLRLKRQVSELEGFRAQHKAEMAAAQQRIGESRLSIIDLKNRFFHEVVNSVKTTRTQINELEEKYLAALDVLNRMVITAPRDGTIVKSRFHTLGGVVPAGQPIMEIVPRGDEMVVEARVDPIDIDVVHKGLDAQVQMTAYSTRNTPQLTGEVIMVSADILSDDMGNMYYTARVKIDEESLRKVETVELFPGMPASVMILTGNRTAVDIALEPIVSSIRKSFLQ